MYNEVAMNEGNVRKWCRLFKESTALAQTCAAAHTRAFPIQFFWEIFDHFQYNPDLAPSNHHLFFLPQKNFGASDSEEWPVDKRRFAGLAERFGVDLFQWRFAELVPRYNKCLDLQATAWEKQFNVSTNSLKYIFCLNSVWNFLGQTAIPRCKGFWKFFKRFFTPNRLLFSAYTACVLIQNVHTYSTSKRSLHTHVHSEKWQYLSCVSTSKFASLLTECEASISCSDSCFVTLFSGCLKQLTTFLQHDCISRLNGRTR